MSLKKMTIAAIAFASCSCTAMAQAPDTVAPVHSNVIEESDGTRTLVHVAEVDAPIADVWATLTTPDGWKMWGPSFAVFDLRLGGSIETGYHEGAYAGDPQNIRHRILAIVPERLIALKVEQAPARGPVNMDMLASMWGVYELEPLGVDRTRMTITGLGYGSDDASLRMLEFFKAGNAYSIELLKKNLSNDAGVKAAAE